MLFRFDLSDKIPPVVFSTATDFFLFAFELVEVSIVVFLVQSTIVFFFVFLIVHDAEEVDGYQARLFMVIAVPCSGLVNLQEFRVYQLLPICVLPIHPESYFTIRAHFGVRGPIRFQHLYKLQSLAKRRKKENLK